MKSYLIQLGICATLLSKLDHWLIKKNFVQVVKKEEIDPKTGKLEPTELYPEGYDSKIEQSKEVVKNPYE